MNGNGWVGYNVWWVKLRPHGAILAAGLLAGLRVSSTSCTVYFSSFSFYIK